MHEKISSRLEENISNYIFDKGLTLKYLNKLRNSTIRQPTNNFFFFLAVQVIQTCRVDYAT